MGFLRSLRSYPFHKLKLQNPSQHNPLTTPHSLTSNPLQSLIPTSIFHKPISLIAQFNKKTNSESINSVNSKEQNKNETKKPLDTLFKEAVGLCEKIQHSDAESENESENEAKELKKKLRKLELEVRTLKENKKRNLKKKSEERDNLEEKTENGNGEVKIEAKSRSLYAFFGGKVKELEDMRMDDTKVYKEILPEMVLFVRHLYDGGYFRDANFLPGNKFDVTCFENSYGRDFIKFAAEKFGRDHQEIAKWLSGSDLKTVALFGCPSLARKNVFSAKRLRTFFAIQEDTVCRNCVLKASCKFVNQSVWKGDTKTLNLAVVMRVITLYALESVPPQLVVPDEVNASVSRLLNEVINLSRTVS